jgi:tetratricopeptide (TPR) repeat protein
VDFASELRDLQHLIAVGQLESAKGKYRAIADRMRCSAEDEEQLLLEFFKAQILAGEDDYSRAIDLTDSLLVRFRALNLRDKAARCHLLLSGLYLRTGDYVQAKAHAEAAVYFCTWELDDKALLGDAHNNLGLALKNLGAWDEAERNLAAAVDAYSGAGDTLRNLRAALNLAILLRKMGKIAEAAEICEDGIRLAQENRIPIGICRYALELANIDVIKRDAEEGWEHLRIARENAEEHAYQRELILTYEIEGDLLGVKGDFERALTTYMKGLGMARALAGDGDLACELLRRASDACLRTGRAREGRQLVDEALHIADQTNDAYEHGVCLRILGALEISQGMQGSGFEHLRESARELADLSAWCHELGVTELLLGEALLDQTHSGNGVSAAEHLLCARRIYSSIGLSPAIRQLDDLIFSSIVGRHAGAATPRSEDRQSTHLTKCRLDPSQYGIITCDERIAGDLAGWGPTEARVLIEGETGVGKELMARALHAMSRRREGPFVAVDCGALSETLADSELFGHARGAFTGAMRDRSGLIEAANGGTLFLDEVGELSEILQVKLLRVLEEGVLRRVGENSPRQVDVRVISATARDLWAEVEAGRFRRDLYYRLKTVLIRVPSLRERPDDIGLLLDHYLRFYGDSQGVSGKLSDEAKDRLLRYSWPGNVRELKNVVEGLILSSHNGDIIGAGRLARFLGNETATSGLKGKIEDLEREEIERVLKACGGNKTKAAEMLGISRKTLWQKLRQFDDS